MESKMSLKISLLMGVSMLMAAVATSGSSAADAKKTVVLVHGAFADETSWDKVVPLLEAEGLAVATVANPLSSLADDVAATKAVIDAQTGPVILVGHSWGGVVITEAGLDDKVKALVYVSAFALPPGVSVNDLGHGQPAPAWQATVIADEKGFLSLSPEGIATYFAQDLPAADQAEVVRTQKPAFAGLFDEKLTDVAYATKPSWYIVAERDGMIPPPAEAAMAAAIGAKVTTIDASHVSMLSKPQEVAAVIIAAAEATN
jgi:pimeloyl-ACP methyl ester carboxylesterase